MPAEGSSGKVATVLAVAPNGGTRTISLANPGKYRRITAVLVNTDASISGGAPAAWNYTGDGVRVQASLRATR